MNLLKALFSLKPCLVHVLVYQKSEKTFGRKSLRSALQIWESRIPDENFKDDFARKPRKTQNVKSKSKIQSLYV